MKLVLSIAEAAEALGVSDDLIYELTERGEIPCLRLGRRKVVPMRAVEAILEECLDGFDPRHVSATLGRTGEDVSPL
jgi:excisionase family DNA binding protein